MAGPDVAEYGHACVLSEPAHGWERDRKEIHLNTAAQE